MDDSPVDYTWNDTLVAEENIRTLLRSRDDYRRRAIKAELELKRLRHLIGMVYRRAESSS